MPVLIFGAEIHSFDKKFVKSAKTKSVHIPDLESYGIDESDLIDNIRQWLISNSPDLFIEIQVEETGRKYYLCNYKSYDSIEYRDLLNLMDHNNIKEFENIYEFLTAEPEVKPDILLL